MSVDNITKDYTSEDPAMPRAYGYYVPKLYEAGEITKELQVSMSSVLMSQDLESKEVVTRDVARQKMFDSMYLVGEEVSKVYIPYIMKVVEVEFCDEKEMVAKHTCGLSRRTVVSPSREGSCGNSPWSHTQIGLPRDVVKRKSK